MAAEVETANRTSIFGNIAQRACTYTKTGLLDGTPFETRGVKVFQFIKGPHGWRISALSWHDEGEGITIPDLL